MIPEKSCRAEAKAGLNRTLAVIAPCTDICFSGIDLSVTNKSCRSVVVVEEEGKMSERGPRKEQYYKSEQEKALHARIAQGWLWFFFPDQGWLLSRLMNRLSTSP